MHSIFKAAFILLCTSGFTFAVASAQAHGQAGVRSESPATITSSSADPDIENARYCKQACDCWYELFPGKVSYCLGTRHWEEGSYESGLQLLELSASWGDKRAQYTLGMIYFGGRHVTPDRARGIAWLLLANERHNNAHIDLVTRSAIHLATPEQYKRAQQLFQEMRKTYGDQVAGARAWSHLKNRVKGPTLFAPRVCILDSGGTVPWSSGLAANPHALCVEPSPFNKSIAGVATAYFNGMTGTVTVGPLQQVAAPASASSTH
ncbi:MAG: hypothetical protein ABI114_15235 [Rhodanobacter sp.]